MLRSEKRSICLISFCESTELKTLCSDILNNPIMFFKGNNVYESVKAQIGSNLNGGGEGDAATPPSKTKLNQ